MSNTVLFLCHRATQRITNICSRPPPLPRSLPGVLSASVTPLSHYEGPTQAPPEYAQKGYEANWIYFNYVGSQLDMGRKELGETTPIKISARRVSNVGMSSQMEIRNISHHNSTPVSAVTSTGYGNDLTKSDGEWPSAVKYPPSQPSLQPSRRRPKVHYNDTEALEVAKVCVEQSQLMANQKGSQFWDAVCHTLQQRTGKNEVLNPFRLCGRD